jgi:hypothetical protein
MSHEHELRVGPVDRLQQLLAARRAGHLSTIPRFGGKIQASLVHL